MAMRTRTRRAKKPENRETIRNQTIAFLQNEPVKYAHMLGFTKLTELHNDWIKDMVFGVGDRTIQGHRGSYKTTCFPVAEAIIMMLYPNDRTAFFRKTDRDVKEIILQTRRILENPVTMELSRRVWGTPLRIAKATQSEINTNLTDDPRGMPQLTGIGTGGSITGKHFDRIFTDDIVNVQDRVSAAERERTKLIYQELQNIKNRGGRIFNTGTPWHEDDCFSIMPEPEKFDCYSTGLISPGELEDIRDSMVPSLFSANYELKHIPAENLLFILMPGQTDGDPEMLKNAPSCHIDAAYGGADSTAFTIAQKFNGKIYVLGKLWNRHVSDVTDEIIALKRRFLCGNIRCENNADHGYLVLELQRKGEHAIDYPEDMNKFIKISTYLRLEWKNIVFVRGTDEAYIKQVTDFNEEAEHDDAPDSLASIIREQWYRQDAGKKIPTTYYNRPKVVMR